MILHCFRRNLIVPIFRLTSSSRVLKPIPFRVTQTSQLHPTQITQMSEVDKAQSATQQRETIFGKIVKGEIRCKFLYEDDKCVVLNDICPQAPVHFLVIPRKPLPTLSDAEDTDEQLLGHLMLVAKNVAKKQNLENGFRVVVNNGVDAAQTVYHLHLHVIGGRRMDWPPG